MSGHLWSIMMETNSESQRVCRRCCDEAAGSPMNISTRGSRGARALAEGELPPIERWNKSRGQSRGEGTNRLRCSLPCRRVDNSLSITKEKELGHGAVSKPALEHFVVVNLVNFPQVN